MLLYDTLRRHSIPADNEGPPLGVTTVYDDALVTLGTIDLNGLSQGDFGWIIVESGRVLIPVPSPNMVNNHHERRDSSGDGSSGLVGGTAWLGKPILLGRR